MIPVAIALLISVLVGVASGLAIYLWAARNRVKFEQQMRDLAEKYRSEVEQRASELQTAQNNLAAKEKELEGLRKPMEAVKNSPSARHFEDPNQSSRQILLDSMQRLAVEYTTQATTSVVNLPSEDVKGRIIGREGRNIRTFETVTGTDLIVDETPEAVVISSFDPIRREVARLTLMNLMLDGRIHPSRIEEIFEKSKEEVDLAIREAGEDAALRAGVPGVPGPVLAVLGRLKFRFSYAQNVLDHSVEVAQLCQLLAQELGLNVEVAKRAGLLHDIGKALDPDWEGSHAIAGMEFLKAKGEPAAITHAVGAHHREIEPSTPEAQIVLIADAVSAARPGARREALDQFVKRLTKLEEVANSFPGVARSYAIQAGREVRVLVKPEEVGDEAAAALAETIAKQIEATLEYPGQIKVTVIRETRSEGIAK